MQRNVSGIPPVHVDGVEIGFIKVEGSRVSGVEEKRTMSTSVMEDICKEN